MAETSTTCVLHVVDMSRRGQDATWHSGDVDTWQIVHFATTGSTTPPTSRQLHVANSLAHTRGNLQIFL
jgi:hypothetical protein